MSERSGMKEAGNSSITTEQGPAMYKRLPSFRSPRDLKLTEFQKIANSAEPKKKVYKPNLNVQRKKQTDESVVKEKVVAEFKINDKLLPIDKGKKDRNKKKQPNLIQSSGVFSEGLAPSMKTGRWNSRFSDSTTPSMLERPKYKGPGKVDKEEEAQVRRDLLRDDFIDDPSCTPDARQCPVKLPLKNFGGDIFYKCEDDMKRVKKEDDAVNNVKVKVEVDDGEPVNVTPVLETVPRTIEEMAPLSISHLMTQSTDTSFFFFQLPHCMPREKTYLPVNSKLSLKPAQSLTNISTISQTTEILDEKCVLKNLPEGKIGKLQLLKSGQAKLLLGDTKFILDSGTQPSFKQDVIALVDMAASTKTGNMVHIGNVTARMIVSPDWESLLTES